MHRKAFNLPNYCAETKLQHGEQESVSWVRVSDTNWVGQAVHQPSGQIQTVPTTGHNPPSLWRCQSGGWPNRVPRGQLLCPKDHLSICNKVKRRWLGNTV
ncbi:hypothetical protein RRG08_048777 [Elysia crispata]|uniref:Uncharacterized protein n=1 Tax=Elysia crispata TaxID=231223 RepID=A0AAE1E1A9_9GAST|nr:hypothetical protein RRG08_048777 [Elysia crispata]